MGHSGGPTHETLESWRRSAIDYVWSRRVDPDGFAFTVSATADQPIAIASATAVLLLQHLGGLSAVSRSEREAWADTLRRRQDPRTGEFIDPFDLAEPTQQQPRWALVAHRTRHVAWAIEALDPRPIEHHFAIVDELVGDSIAEWLDQIWRLHWPGGFWQAGNWIMDVGVMLDLQARHFEDRQAEGKLHELLDALDCRIEPDTGLWRGPGDDDRNAMAGSMHLYPLYWAYGRQPPSFNAAVARTLALQAADGLFSAEPGLGGEQCLDFDAMLVFANGHAAVESLREPIERAAHRLLDAIVLNRNDDGSWADSQRDELRHWGTRAAAFRCRDGSLWDTYARLMTVAYATRVLDVSLPNGWRLNHHLFEICDCGAGWSQGRPPRA